MPAPPDLSGLPAGFRWGVATAAFQIEGDAEHRGRSIWDRICARPGWIVDGSDATVACDHVNRYRADVGLLRELGLDAYRFSIAWPRVQPTGKGPLAPAGLAFYDRLVDALLEAGIQPWVTQYHWDLPEELQDAGGWVERDIADWFADYAVSIHAALGDRVRHWATLNEPWCSAWLGYGSGEHAPGLADHRLAARAAHHLLLAHGRAVAGMRAQAPADHQLGIVLNLFPVRMDDGVPAAERGRVREAVDRLDGLQNRWWLDALLEGRYPQVLAPLSRHLEGVVRDGDLDVVAQPLDFLGVNYYHDAVIAAATPEEADERGPYPGMSGVGPAEPEGEATSMGWPVTPTGLRDVLVRVGAEHPTAPPLVVTENGSAWDDDDLVDRRRVDYLHQHLVAVVEAVRAGADVRGYFAWSFMDNFEWACGYSQKFGLVEVDFDTLERRPRASFAAYRAVMDAARRRVAPVAGSSAEPAAAASPSAEPAAAASPSAEPAAAAPPSAEPPIGAVARP
jgi:beta-glucosidase